MKALLLVAAIAAMIGTVLVTLTAVVFCLGMGANSTPAQIRELKLWMLGLGGLGAAGVGAGVFLLRVGRPGWAVAASLAPSVIVGLILVVALIR